MENYLISIIVFVGIYAIMALAMNLIWGLTGLINLGLAGFYAVGAYTSALATTRLGLPIPIAIVAAVLVSALVGAFVAVITARLQGDYLAIVTLGVAELVRLVASNELWLTNGTDGISGIPGPWRSELTPLQFNLLYMAIVIVAALAAFLLLSRVSRSPFGRVLRSIREDEVVASIAGKNPLSFKIRTFAVGCALLGFAGALFAHYSTYIAPDVFLPIVTIHIILAVTVGGVGNMGGALLGALIVVALGEITRFAAGYFDVLGGAQTAALRESLIALFLIVLLNVQRHGLLPEKMTVREEPKQQ
jgi:branched-chain amino acid transport system permease protein